MTETRKAIIELIELYMDKTLSEWCLIKPDWDNWEYNCILYKSDKYIWLYKIWTIPVQRVDFSWWYSNFETIYIDDFKNKEEEYKIIWHYDITSVLKYIAIEKWIRYTEHWDDHIYFYDEISDISIGKIAFKIHSKPLHLYTEEEEKELLNLLIK